MGKVILIVNKKRPVNLDIATFKLPITAYVSILHRVSGVFLFAGATVFLWLLDKSLSSQDSFNELVNIAEHPVCRFIVWIVVAALAYHTVMGLRHLIMDFGIGESLEGGQRGAKIALAVAAVLIALAGVWLW
jgi:succinate dehydrogenase / fumarate reductase, cytochrome b subunit